MSYRIEKDTIGEIKVPSDKYWGAQTERSKNNFKIGPAGSMPIEIVHAFAVLKKAAAITNSKLGVLDENKMELISLVCKFSIHCQSSTQGILVLKINIGK